MSDPFLSFVAITLIGGLCVLGILGYLAVLVGIVRWIDKRLPDHYPDWAAPAMLFAVWGVPAVFILPFDFTYAAPTIGISAAMGLFTWWQLKKIKRKAALAPDHKSPIRGQSISITSSSEAGSVFRGVSIEAECIGGGGGVG